LAGQSADFHFFEYLVNLRLSAPPSVVIGRSAGVMGAMMRAARLHAIDKPFVIEELPMPSPRDNDVLVRVGACGVVPNLRNIIRYWNEWLPHLPTPPLPAIYGLDAAGEIAAVGAQVRGFKAGDRVYVNPGHGCGSCRHCREGHVMNCRAYTFRGYFGFGPGSTKIFEDYPYGGFSEYLLAPTYSLVRLPDNVPFEAAARLGYIGTAYAGIRKAGVGGGSTVLIDGISGTLGLGACLVALALGIPHVLGTGRNQALLDRVKALAPGRIEVQALGARATADWALERTGGDGVDAVIECVGPNTPASTVLDAFGALRRGGRAVNISGAAEPLAIDPHWLMDGNIQVIGSVWFTAAEGEDLAIMGGAGTLDLSVYEHRRYALAELNEAVDGVQTRNGGFTNVVVGG
jgi:alcohol dehydrogenase